jgi:hypothetical protein
MKNILFALGFLTMLTFFSCDKDSASSDEGIIVLQVDGKEWKSLKEKTSVMISSNLMNVSGIAADGSIITFTLQGKTAKTYALSQFSTSSAIFQQSVSSSFASNQGNDPSAQVVISEFNTVDSIVSGTFKFTGFRIIDGKKVSITGGVINKIKLGKPIISAGTGSLKCKIDGVKFEAGLRYATKAPIFEDIIFGASVSDSYPIVSFVLEKGINVGTHQIKALSSSNYGNYIADGSGETYLSTAGTITITKHDKTLEKIEGTFSFDCKRNNSTTIVKITEGTFVASY